MSAVHAASTTRTTVAVQQQSLTGEWYTARATATTRKHLNGMVAPPRLPAWFVLPALGAAGLAVLLLCSAGALVDSVGELTPSALLGVGLVVLILAGMVAGAVVLTVVGWRQRQAQLPEHNRRLQHWQRLYYCGRCEQSFLPPTVQATGNGGRAEVRPGRS